MVFIGFGGLTVLIKNKSPRRELKSQPTGQAHIVLIFLFVDYNFMKFDLSKLEISVFDKRKEIIFPNELSVELAELIGILVGDGHLSVLKRIGPTGKIFTQSTIFVSGNSNEKEYLGYIQNLFLTLFNTHLTSRKDKRSDAILLVCYSKGIVNYLSKVCQIPVGKKCATVRIPRIIFDSNIHCQRAFLRGLVDTDFYIAFKKTKKGIYSYPNMRGSFKSKGLVEDLYVMFGNLNFSPYALYDVKRHDKRWGDYVMQHVYLLGKDNLYRWMDEIGFSHYKNILKVETWRKTGESIPINKRRAPAEI